jgi:hypothetical protein
MSPGPARAVSPTHARGLRPTEDSDTDDTVSDASTAGADDAPLVKLVRSAAHSELDHAALPPSPSPSAAGRELQHERRMPDLSVTDISQGLRSALLNVPPPPASAPASTLAVPGAGPTPRPPKLATDILAHPPASTSSLPSAALALPAH